MSSVLVLALNPCVAAEWRADGLRWQEKNLVLKERRWAGGKEVNVAHWLKLFRVPVRLLLPLGNRPSGKALTCLGERQEFTEVLPRRVTQ